MKTALITGGSRGIGKATVQQFLNSGYKVITTSTSGRVDLEGENLESYQLDLSDSNSIKEFVKSVGSQEIDVLINNGATDREEEGININMLRETLEVNLIGTIDLTEKLLANIRDKGVIINISSEYGALGDDWGNVVPSYRISKAALNMYTRTLYKRVENQGVRVYSFDPGWVKTDMGGSDAPRKTEEPAKELLELSESDNPSGFFYRGLEKRSW